MNNENGKGPCIFLIEEDNDVRALLKNNLQRDGYRVRLALNEEDALERIGEGHVPADLLLINLVDKSEYEVLSIGRRIREHAKYDGHTPLVVLADKYGADLEGTNANPGSNDWIAYLEDHDQLRNLLASLFNRPSI